MAPLDWLGLQEHLQSLLGRRVQITVSAGHPSQLIAQMTGALARAEELGLRDHVIFAALDDDSGVFIAEQRTEHAEHLAAIPSTATGDQLRVRMGGASVQFELLD